MFSTISTQHTIINATTVITSALTHTLLVPVKFFITCLVLIKNKKGYQINDNPLFSAYNCFDATSKML
jgi:hypothetical protein